MKGKIGGRTRSFPEENAAAAKWIPGDEAPTSGPMLAAHTLSPGPLCGSC